MQQDGEVNLVRLGSQPQTSQGHSIRHGNYKDWMSFFFVVVRKWVRAVTVEVSRIEWGIYWEKWFCWELSLQMYNSLHNIFSYLWRHSSKDPNRGFLVELAFSVSISICLFFYPDLPHVQKTLPENEPPPEEEHWESEYIFLGVSK
jgi:hypothetical protein